MDTFIKDILRSGISQKTKAQKTNNYDKYNKLILKQEEFIEQKEQALYSLKNSNKFKNLYNNLKKLKESYNAGIS